MEWGLIVYLALLAALTASALTMNPEIDRLLAYSCAFTMDECWMFGCLTLPADCTYAEGTAIYGPSRVQTLAKHGSGVFVSVSWAHWPEQP